MEAKRQLFLSITIYIYIAKGSFTEDDSNLKPYVTISLYARETASLGDIFRGNPAVKIDMEWR